MSCRVVSLSSLDILLVFYIVVPFFKRKIDWYIECHWYSTHDFCEELNRSYIYETINKEVEAVAPISCISCVWNWFKMTLPPSFDSNLFFCFQWLCYIYIYALDPLQMFKSSNAWYKVSTTQQLRVFVLLLFNCQVKI